MARLEEEIRRLSEETNFIKTSLVMFIFTGLKPFLPSVKLVKKINMNKTMVQVDFYRRLNYEEFQDLHHKIRRMLKPRKKSLKRKHSEIYKLVEKNGGVPKRSEMRFWEEKWVEWNSSHPADEFKSPYFIRIAYHRILHAIKALG